MSWILELKNVTKNFDSIIAIDDINLKIHEGEILALLGPSGSGKTTLLKILAFLEKPSKGEIYFYDKKITDKDIPLMHMETTMVFQKSIMFNTTVYNNIAYGLKIRKIPKDIIDKKVSEVLRIVKLEGFEKKNARNLSGGEQQRVALARALALNTKIILLDEPTANLDPKNASIIEEIISTFNKEFKNTIVIATHNIFQAKNISHRIALIMNGKIMETGTPKEIFRNLSKTLTSFAMLENTFTGIANLTKDGTTIIDIGNGIEIEASTQAYGKVSIFINPEDIIISKNLFTSSARNIFKGKIIEISDLGPIVKLKIDIGKIFTVQITKCSFNEMGLNLGMEVFLAFKASSVQII